MTRRSILVLLLLFALVGGYVAGCATSAPGQPHMQAALDHLRLARGQLQKATVDKGGHRARAIALVNKAIAEVQAGINFDRRN